MEAMYTLKSGVKLTTFLWADLSRKETWREVIEVQRIKNNKRCKACKKKIFKDSHDIYFVWDGQKVYINDYDYMPVTELVKFIEDAREKKWVPYFEDKLFATIVRDTENVGIIFDMPVYEAIMPQLGIAFTGDKEVKTLCIPSEKHYKKSSWGYKFSLEAANDDYRGKIASRDFYFSDFTSLIMSGNAEIVVKNDFLEEQRKIANYKPTFKEKVMRFFSKKEEKEIIYC